MGESEEGGETEPVDLREAEAVHSSWTVVKDGRSDAELTVSGDRKRIIADYDRLQQLLENLFQNPIEHGGSDVTITVGCLDDSFYVEDDGRGIPEPKRKRVFETGYTTHHQS